MARWGHCPVPDIGHRAPSPYPQDPASEDAGSTGPWQCTPTIHDDALSPKDPVGLLPVGMTKTMRATYGPLISPSFSLPQIETQVRMPMGIDLEQDVFPLLSGELVLDLNDGTPPLLAAYAAQIAGQNSSPAATIPGGSALLALHVPDAPAAQASIARLIAALNRQMASSTVRVVRTTLADGSTDLGLLLNTRLRRHRGCGSRHGRPVRVVVVQRRRACGQDTGRVLRIPPGAPATLERVAAAGPRAARPRPGVEPQRGGDAGPLRAVAPVRGRAGLLPQMRSGTCVPCFRGCRTSSSSSGCHRGRTARFW
jgi:hypothetical protein